MSIFDALPIVAASYGDKFGVTVRVSGTGAYTNGHIINVPALDLKKNPELKNVLWGYLSHESGHIKFTDFSVVASSNFPPIGMSVQNLIEDVWMENALIDMLPGTRFTLDETIRFMVDGSDNSDAYQEQSEVQVFWSYLWNWLRCEYRDQVMLHQAWLDAKQEFEAVFPTALCSELESLIRAEMPKVKSTQAANRLTGEILDLLKKHMANEQPQQQNGGQNPNENQDQQSCSNSSNDQDGPDGNDDSSSDGGSEHDGTGFNDFGADGGSEPDSSSEESGDDLSPPEDAESCSASDSSACQKVLDAEKSDIKADFDDQLRELLEAAAMQSGDRDYDGLPELSYDRELMFPADKELIKDGLATSVKLRARLIGLVQSKQLRRSWESSSGSHINSRRIDRVLSGDMRIFSREAEKNAPNADVCILMDLSGSMGDIDELYKIANPACAALALALSQIKGVSTCAASFPGQYSDVGPIQLIGSDIRQHVERFGVRPRGFTPMAEALLWSIKELGKGKGKKKVVIALTDGDPDYPYSSTYTVLEEMEKSGIYVVGIGIKTNAVSQFFKNHVVINDIDDLGPQLFDIARELII